MSVWFKYLVSEYITQCNELRIQLHREVVGLSFTVPVFQNLHIPWKHSVSNQGTEDYVSRYGEDCTYFLILH